MTPIWIASAVAEPCARGEAVFATPTLASTRQASAAQPAAVSARPRDGYLEVLPVRATPPPFAVESISNGLRHEELSATVAARIQRCGGEVNATGRRAAPRAGPRA